MTGKPLKLVLQVPLNETGGGRFMRVGTKFAFLFMSSRMNLPVAWRRPGWG